MTAFSKPLTRPSCPGCLNNPADRRRADFLCRQCLDKQQREEDLRRIEEENPWDEEYEARTW